jgi:hypothetical protein
LCLGDIASESPSHRRTAINRVSVSQRVGLKVRNSERDKRVGIYAAVSDSYA